MLLSDSAYPSEGSSVSSWGEGSSLSGSANHLFLVTEYHEGTSNDDNVTDVSSLPAHIEDFQDHSPSNWSSSSIRNEMAMMMYAHPNSPRPLPDSIKTWCKVQCETK